jgi:hypothetical protein
LLRFGDTSDLRAKTRIDGVVVSARRERELKSAKSLLRGITVPLAENAES